MTDRPKLYPGHMHEWTRVGQTSPDMVRCTVCGFQAPRNVAGLDGQVRRYTDAEWQEALAQGRELARQLGIPLVSGADLPDDEPEQETPSVTLEDLLHEQRRVLAAARKQLEDTIDRNCAGPHAYIQHRDGRPPWCPTCRRTATGVHTDQVQGLSHNETGANR